MGTENGVADAGLDLERAMERFASVRTEMNRQTVIHDWHFRMLLESGLTDLWIAKGDLAKARTQGERFLDVTLATAERTWQARAWEINARIAMAERDLTRAESCISNGLSVTEGFEVPLGAWRVHATAADINECLANKEHALYHGEMSRSILVRLANSLGAEERLKQTFLSAPVIRRILERQMQRRMTEDEASIAASVST